MITTFSQFASQKERLIYILYLTAEKPLKHNTLGHTYNEFGYYEHSAIASRLFSEKRWPLIDINVWKVQI